MATTRLSQILAVLPDAKNRAKKSLEGVLHTFNSTQTSRMAGIQRTYKPKDDEGDKLPAEQTQVQLRVPELLDGLQESLADLLNLEFTSVKANTSAVATVKLDGQPDAILVDVPVTYLIFLEKQLTDLRKVVSLVPTLDPAETWSYNNDAVAFATVPTETTRTKKVPRNHEKAPATDKHPAQVEMFYEDVIVGYWATVKTSGAIRASVKVELIQRIDTLRRAVKAARSEGNTLVVEQERTLGRRIFGYLFDPLTDLR